MNAATAFETVAAALREHGCEVIGDHRSAKAQCPAHDDNSPSLSINPRSDGNGIVLKCHAGCTTAAVVAKINFTMGHLFDEPKVRSIFQPQRDYHYPGGRVVHRKPGKSFPQSGDKTDRSLFGSDNITDDTTLVYVVEGEKDVEAVRAAGGVGVCSAMGAGKAHLADWSPLKGKKVVIVSDRDDAGRKHAEQVAKQLDGIAEHIQIVEPADGKDFADHYAAGHTLDELRTVSDLTTDGQNEPEPTSWETFDLGPWLDGTHKSPQPGVGISRTDGQKLLYPGREHTVFGETEAGKTWFCLESAAVEIRMGRDVVYIHYEEGDPQSTIERLRLLALTPAQIRKHLRFVAPAKPAHADWLDALLDPPPSLVIHDGVNEAMSLHADKIMDVDGSATFRRRLIKPCLRVGAATLCCDHVTKNSDTRGRYAIGSVHKINAIDGAAFLIENVEPFGRSLRGASHIYVTKDRPGQLRARGKPTKQPGKTFIGTLAVDDTPMAGPDFLTFYAPTDDHSNDTASPDDELADTILNTIAALPGQQVRSFRALMEKLRKVGDHHFRDTAVRDIIDDLLATQQLEEFNGRSGGRGLRVVPTASQPSQTRPLP